MKEQSDNLTIQPIERKDTGWDLKSPCKDCPFRTDAPKHNGIFKALPVYHSHFEKGTFSQSCHKTDPRADGYDPNYKGKVQHCAGAMIMCHKDPECSNQLEMELAKGMKKLDESKLNMKAPVFDSFIEMIRYYLNLFDPDGSRRKKLGDNNETKK